MTSKKELICACHGKPVSEHFKRKAKSEDSEKRVKGSVDVIAPQRGASSNSAVPLIKSAPANSDEGANAPFKTPDASTRSRSSVNNEETFEAALKVVNTSASFENGARWAREYTLGEVEKNKKR